MALYILFSRPESERESSYVHLTCINIIKVFILYDLSLLNTEGYNNRKHSNQHRLGLFSCNSDIIGSQQ